MTDTGNKDTSTEQPKPAEGATGPAPNADPPEWFRKHVEWTKNRFDGLARNLPTQQATEPAKGQPAAVSQDDLDASMRLGEVRAALSPDQREHLDQLRSEGFTIAQLARVAEGFKKGSPPASNAGHSGGSNPPPPGNAPNAPPSTTPRLPETVSELRDLKKKDPKAFEAIWPLVDIKKLRPV